MRHILIMCRYYSISVIWSALANTREVIALLLHVLKISQYLPWLNQLDICFVLSSTTQAKETQMVLIEYFLYSSVETNEL